MPDRLTRDFFARPVLEVAPELLGCTVSHAGVTVRLTEVEAYDGPNDPGSHAFRGQTPRTEVMFGEPGGLYVYFTYGMHWCANLVCGPSGTASAVLLRAGEIVGGLEVARSRRAGVTDRRLADLARGPARLTMSLALTKDHNGVDTTAPDSPVVIRATAGPLGKPGSGLTPDPVSDPSSSPLRGQLPQSLSALLSGATLRAGPRVGVSGPGGDGTAYPWRFWLAGEATVSSYRPATARPPKPALRPHDR